MIRGHALPLLALAAATLLVYHRLLFGNLIPAGGDFMFYFAPYWDYVNEILRSGQLPLWNPYIFAGAPLQANPQAQIFYPLRWLFIPLPTAQGMALAAALHAWLAGVFAYALARRALGVSALGGLAAGMIFALNGWATGLLNHPNRWASLPWLPAALWLWEARGGQWPRPWDRASRRWLALLALVWALALLAGHSQTFYNQAVIFACWAAAPALWAGWQALRRRTAAAWAAVWQRGWPVAALLILIFGLAFALAAVQTLPTLEVSGHSYRSGGLAYRDHAALSLPPWRLGFTLLPHYARDLGQALGSDAYGEWLAYTGLTALLLAAMGLGWGGRRPRWLAAALVLAGLFLAVGAYNPLNYLLYRLVPGWDLFRVPARWLEATVLGLSLLAAGGAERIARGLPRRWPRPIFVAGGGLLLLAALTRPTGPTLAGWAAALALAAAILHLPGRGRVAAGLLLGLALLELYAASFVLPLQHPTAGQALWDWRTAPARIAAELGPRPRFDACRTLSLSATTYDPGDLADLRQVYGPYLDEQGLAALVDAAKAREVLAPNLSLLYRLPSFDGFGGGVLPTRRFVQTMSLFLPPERIVPDGRLREQLREIPDARLLSLFGVCMVIADKTFDHWHEGVYYDLAFGETLSPTQPQLTFGRGDASGAGFRPEATRSFPLASPLLPAFPIDQVGVISHLVGGAAVAQGEPVLALEVVFADGSRWQGTLAAGVEVAEGRDAGPPLAHSRDLPHVRWRYDAAGQDTIALLPLPARLARPTSLRLTLLRQDVAIFVRGIALIDRASAAHATLPVTRHPWQRIHSGDVKIYRNAAVLPRVWLAPAAEISPDDAVTLARLADPGFDPAQTLLLAAGEARSGGAGAASLVSYTPERIVIAVQAEAPAYVLVADAWYPGWQAVLDAGAPAGQAAQAAQALPVERADLLLRAVPVPAGQHTLTLTFRPASLRWGAWITLAAAGLLLWLWRRD